jgi:hypothetical protein
MYWIYFLLLFQDLTKYLKSKSLKDSEETLEHIISLLVDLTRIEPSVVEEFETSETRFLLYQYNINTIHVQYMYNTIQYQ